MRGIAARLIAEGHDVVSRWLGEPYETDDASVATILEDRQACLQMASRDLEDIARAELLILFTDVGDTRGGKMVEFGFALAKGIDCSVIGPMENIFCHLGKPQPRWYRLDGKTGEIKEVPWLLPLTARLGQDAVKLLSDKGTTDG